jgi:hypothetical protein
MRGQKKNRPLSLCASLSLSPLNVSVSVCICERSQSGFGSLCLCMSTRQSMSVCQSVSMICTRRYASHSADFVSLCVWGLATVSVCQSVLTILCCVSSLCLHCMRVLAIIHLSVNLYLWVVDAHSVSLWLSEYGWYSKLIVIVSQSICVCVITHHSLSLSACVTRVKPLLGVDAN